MFRFLAALLLLPVLGAYGWLAGGALAPLARHPQPLFPFAIGGAAWLLTWLLYWRKSRPSVWQPFRHELAHALFCLLLFKRVHSFEAGARANSEGRLGMVRHDQGSGLSDVLITLAPYFFPTATVALLALRPWLLPACRPWIDGVIGASFCFHLFSFFADTGLHQADIRKHGVFFSTIFIGLMNIIITVSTLLIVHGGNAEAWHYLSAGPEQLWQWGHTAWPDLSRHLP
jgi:hypothetical protein